MDLDDHCSVDECDRPIAVKSRRLCNLHYARWWDHGDTEPKRRPKQTCTVEGCDRHGPNRGLCNLHHHRFKRYGTYDLPPAPVRPEHCTVVGCSDPIESSGLCTKHRSRARQRGAPEAVHTCQQCGGTIDGRGWKYCSRECKAQWEYHQRRATQREVWLRQYGLTVDEYDAMLAGQSSACAICRRTDPGGRGWCVDHCHDTGRVRGILCTKCNLGIGYFDHDAAAMLAAVTCLE